MKLSKEVVDLESSKRLSLSKEFKRITESDPEFAKIIEYYEEQIVRLALTNKAGEDSLVVKAEQATNLLHRFALNIYRIMCVQAEIDEVEKECGTKEEN